MNQKCVTYLPERMLPLTPVYTAGEGWGEGVRWICFLMKPICNFARSTFRRDEFAAESRSYRRSLFLREKFSSFLAGNNLRTI